MNKLMLFLAAVTISLPLATADEPAAPRDKAEPTKATYLITGLH